MAQAAVPGKCGRGWWLLFCGKSLKTQRVYLFDISKRKDGFQNFTMKDSIPGDETFVTFSTHRADRSPTQPLSSGHASFHHPKKVTSRIARYRFFFFPFVFKSRSPTQPTPWDVLATRNAVWRKQDLVGKSLCWLPCSNVAPCFVGWGGVGRCFFFSVKLISNPRMSKVSLGHFFLGGCKMLRVRIFESRIHAEHCLWGLGYEENLPPNYQQSTNSSIGTIEIQIFPLPSVVGRLFGGWGAENQNASFLNTSIPSHCIRTFFLEKKPILEKPTCWCMTSGSSGWQDALVMLHGRFCGRNHI